MKFSKLDLLTLLISLFIFSSCEKSATIGIDIDNSVAMEGTLVDTITISTKTVLDENASTLALTRYPLGFLKDPTFGTTESALAFSVNIPSDNFSFGQNPSIDSAVLVLNYSSEFYGDSTSNYNFNVHQLTNDINDATTFLSNATYNYHNTIIGNKTTKLFPTTPIKVLDIVTSAADTIRTATPQIRIKLDNNFAQDYILNASESTLKTNLRFLAAFRGLHVQVNKQNSSGNGAMMFIDFSNENSNLAIYYKQNKTGSTTEKDTASAYFPISTISGLGPIAASIKHDYTNTPIATQLANPNQQYATTYLQPLAGVKNKISFPYLREFVKNAGKIAINKAELVIDVSNGTDIKPFIAAPRLALYRYDIAGQRQNLPDNDPATDPRGLDATSFGGYYDSVKKQYKFIVTSYLQDLITGKTKDYGTFLAPTAQSEFTYLTTSFGTAARAVIGAYKKNPGSGDNVMKLNIYYTKIN